MHIHLDLSLFSVSDDVLHQTTIGCTAAGSVHPLRGPIFESWIASEIYKHYANHGLTPPMFFFRDRAGNEVDFALDRGTDLLAVEVKAGRTPSSAYFRRARDTSARFGTQTRRTRKTLSNGCGTPG